MNSIGGVLKLDGSPIGRAGVVRMNRAAQLLLPYRPSFWFGGPIGLACSSTKGAVCLVDGNLLNGRCRPHVLAFDGRLDNRRELIRQLCEPGGPTGMSDGELVLAAYEAWGDSCALRLIGDFAFALWDGIRRRLLCVRDPLGVRPLYVSVRDGRVCFASQLRQVLAALLHTPAFDLEFVADRLVHGVDRADAGCTPYRGVSRLRPGHRLIAESGRVRVERYWEWRGQDEGAGLRRREYVEQFQETFSEAVASRMRGTERVWSDLSGGLDSSSIVSVAAQLQGASRLRTISVVFGESTLSDEREWSASVAQAHRVERHLIDGDTCHPLSRLREAVDYWEEPHAAAAFFGVHQQYQALVADDGVPVLLTGIGAEAVVMSKRQVPLHLADVLRCGKIGALGRDIDRWQRVLKMPLSNLIWRYCLRPLVNRPLVSYDWMTEIHSWIEKDFVRRWDLSARAKYAGMPHSCRGVADQWHVEAIGRITGFLLRGYLEKACDIRYPFLHRPLVELALVTPWSLKAVPGEPKALLRRAMRGIVPESVRRRTRDASTGHAVYTGLRKEWRDLERMAASSILVDLGIINRKRLQNALDLAHQGHAPNLGGLLSTLTLDAWLQNAARKGDSAWLNSAA